MSFLKPTYEEQESLHQFYLSCRKLLSRSVVSKIAVQKSFEEALHGFSRENSWRPTHISAAAALEALRGNTRSIQRAHGLIKGRLDRFERTITLLEGSEKSFEEWWKFYIEHDATVLITREEHGSGRGFSLEELISLPDPSAGLFVAAGFSFKIRKNYEIKWLKSVIKDY